MSGEAPNNSTAHDDAPAIGQLDALELSLLPSHRRNLTLAKLRILNDLDAYLHSQPPRSATRATRQFIADRKGHYQFDDRGESKIVTLSLTSIYRWRDLFRDGGLMGLATDDRGAHKRLFLAPEAVTRFKQLRDEKSERSLNETYWIVRHEADFNGWEWFTTAEGCRYWAKRGCGE